MKYCRQKDVAPFEEICRILIDETEDLIYILDRKGCYIFVNPWMARFLSREIEQIIGRSVSSFMPEADAQEQIKSVNRIYTDKKRVKTEFTILKGDRAFLYAANLVPLKDKKGDVCGVLGIARDITEPRNFENQLITTEKLASLGTLAAGVAHQINNPLSIILGFCDLLLEKIDPESLIYRDLRTIERHGLYCKKVVENLLGFARIAEGDEVSVDVNHAVELVLGIIDHTFLINGITVEKNLAPSLPRACGDTKQLQQVFLSLITNAIEAMKNGGALGISTGMSGPLYIFIRISDTGEGIDEKYLDKIFDPFFTTKPEGEGTGLGLSVSYGIIRKYGGTISCESKTGKPSGTNLTVRLPIFKGAQDVRTDIDRR
ncbi:MAG: ATP-binding protein [Thermodesulfobacteriota bacterium]